MSHAIDILQKGIDDGLHSGAQIFVSRNGAPIIDAAVGESRPGVAMSTDTINLWMSAVKPFVAVAIAQLWERGKLRLDQRIAEFIPEFAVNGKEPITVRHILTHTCGFRAVVGLRLNDAYEDAVQKVCAAPLEPRWIIGQSAAYHATGSWYVLAELVRRIDGRMIDRYLREEIFLPLKMNDCRLGLPGDVYRAAGERIGFVFDTAGQSSKPLDIYNSEASAAILRPTGNGRGPMKQLARFYESLLADDCPILSPQTREAITTRQRAGILDQTFKRIIDWGLGFMLNSTQYGDDAMPYGFGKIASLRAFGHGGAQSCCTYADPVSKTVVAWMCNGMPGEAAHHRRQQVINEAIDEELRGKSEARCEKPEARNPKPESSPNDQ